MLSFTAQRSLPSAGSATTHYLETLWREACEELSVSGGRDTVSHEVDISLVNGPDGAVQTKYSVFLDAAVTSQFDLRRRVGRPTQQEVDTWGQQFADVVAITTADSRRLRTYLTNERRSVIVQLLQRFPTAKISNEALTGFARGTDPDRAQAVLKLGQLVDAAAILQPMWADVPLDERSVIADLFGSYRDVDGISDRFEDLYRGSVVRWTGEAVQVGEAGHSQRWAAMLVGSADGRTAESGRVVAMAAVDPETEMERGDVISFEGMLVHLDAKKRYLRIA